MARSRGSCCLNNFYYLADSLLGDIWMNEIEKIDYIIETIIKTLKAMEDDNQSLFMIPVGILPQWELKNSLELLKDLREPLFLKKP